MAEDTNPTARVETAKPTDGTQIPDEDAGGFHYYSGGDVKELADTRVSPWLWGFWTIVLIGAVSLGLAFGALGPHSGRAYRPVGGSAAERAKIQADLDQRGAYPVSVINLAAIDLPQGVTLKSAISDGEGIYQNKCFGCHGPNQDGNGANAASLNPKPRNLRDAPFMQSMSYQRINTSIHKGVPGTAMPRWEGTLSDDEIKEVIAYVWSLSAPKAATAAPDATAGALAPGAGGAAEYTGGSQQVSPKPITPSINGDVTAHTTTAPPSASGQPSAPDAASQPSSQTTGTGPQSVSPIPNNPANADGTGPNLQSPAPVAQPAPASSGPSAGAGAPAATH
ncbi:hypothetical protein CCAX7_10080 [Capsulimonas corticalis]|uniref:Uncharacterized protein n=1 Tax=Capsulimonas corticalis TaxID=2219043 RepID=A0A402CUG9_9BACT|nr:cytochrome c [Capsulimonas corticalis]BDI28957.1 hypothetical protein CCAX7_10080 [Capsulimonas corticalis]